LFSDIHGECGPGLYVILTKNWFLCSNDSYSKLLVMDGNGIYFTASVMFGQTVFMDL